MSDTIQPSGSVDKPRVDAGGEFLALDPSDPKDQALMRRQMTRNPGRFMAITESKRTRMVDLAMKAADVAEARMGSDDKATQDMGAQLAQSVVKTFAMMDALKQRDEHAERGIGGGPSQPIVQVNIVHAAPKREVAGE